MTDRRRPLGTSIARDTHERFSTGTREQVRAARAYAERWYQALREWRTYEGDEVLVSRGPARASRMRVVGIGSYSTSGTGFGSVRVSETLVQTPLGVLTEARVALAITQQRSELLERVRGEQALGSLIHPSGRGWNQPSDRAQAYAFAVLSVAVALGDADADIHKSYLSNARV